ncbi:hypothetical protein PVAP13_9KG339200 [Panicum virgatum]|uniref:CCHC-type domain-containing protein n=1 Tax=Panicum virgatum TaxID=38727 RepID=A0A8T0NQG0_PANVG|nr:hypothetical protein PVAP13_9KG339200 [Panicum virgatum]
MGGGRFSHGRRRNLRSSRFNITKNRSGGSLLCFVTDAFNCLSYSHRVATCRLPWRCLRCRGFGHLAKKCKRLRSGRREAICHVALFASSTLRPPNTRPEPIRWSRVGPCGVPRRELVFGDDAGDAGVCRVDVSMGAPAGFFDNTTTAYLSPCLIHWSWSCAGEGPPAWVDPMLEELVASLALTVGAPAVECSPPPPVASHGVDASLGDTHSPVKGAHWTMDSPLLSPVEEGQPGAAVALTRPTHPDAATVEAVTDVANCTSPQMSSIDEPVRDTICGPEQALPTSSSRRNVTVAQGTREALLL